MIPCLHNIKFPVKHIIDIECSIAYSTDFLHTYTHYACMHVLMNGDKDIYMLDGTYVTILEDKNH